MSDPAPAAAAEASPKKSKKKLIIMLAAVLVLAGGGGGGFFYMKQKAAAAAAAAAEEEGDETAAAKDAHKDTHKDAKAKPTYVPLDAFVVNLADRDSDRFAQIGITLQVDDTHVADDMKTYMPTLRNGILMILAHKSSEELLQRDGKETLAQEILVASARALGIEVEDPQAEVSHGKGAKKTASDDEDEDQPKKSKKNKKKKKKTVHNPVTHVHFSNFIIQ